MHRIIYAYARFDVGHSGLADAKKISVELSQQLSKQYNRHLTCFNGRPLYFLYDLDFKTIFIA